jgi:hypothetical protein
VGYLGAIVTLPTIRSRGIVRNKDGSLSIYLSPHEKSVLGSLPDQTVALARAGDASTARLFPPAYIDDPYSEADYITFTRTDLVDSCAQALELFKTTLNSPSISEADAYIWLRALNSIRLVIGTKLNIQQDEIAPDPETISEDDIRSQGLLLYGYLTWLQSELIEALNS